MGLPVQRLPKKPIVLESRPLSRADLACLPQQRQENGIAQKLRSHHHRLARLDAAGLKDQDICEIAGISHQRLWQMRKSPAFTELVSQYRATVDAVFEQAQDEFARASVRNMVRAEQQIEDHLDQAEENGELLPVKLLLDITGDRADRFGYPKGKVVATVNMGSALEKAMVRSGRTITVDAKVNSNPTLAPREPGNNSPQLADPAPATARALVSRRGF